MPWFLRSVKVRKSRECQGKVRENLKVPQCKNERQMKKIKNLFKVMKIYSFIVNLSYQVFRACNPYGSDLLGTILHGAVFGTDL